LVSVLWFSVFRHLSTFGPDNEPRKHALRGRRKAMWSHTTEGMDQLLIESIRTNFARWDESDDPFDVLEFE